VLAASADSDYLNGLEPLTPCMRCKCAGGSICPVTRSIAIRRDDDASARSAKPEVAYHGAAGMIPLDDDGGPQAPFLRGLLQTSAVRLPTMPNFIEPANIQPRPQTEPLIDWTSTQALRSASSVDGRSSYTDDGLSVIITGPFSTFSTTAA
jgi:hypothetical protein